MKIGGVSVTAPAEEMLVLPRGEHSLVFRAKPLKDMDEFDSLSPQPEPPGKLTKNGWEPDPTEPNYQTILQQYSLRRVAYIVIRSLEPSEIEWDTVDINNPKTWTKWDSDLLNAGMTQVEVNQVLNLVIETNSLSEEKLKKAREDFLLGQALAKAASSGHPAEPQTTQSGEPVSESA